MTVAAGSHSQTGVMHDIVAAMLVNKRLVFGWAGLALLVAAAVLASQIAPYSPIEQHLDHRFAPPFSVFPLGTDHLGRDILSRLLHGLRPSLLSGLFAVALAAVAGTVLGMLGGYFGGVLDAAIGRVVDLLIAWPSIFIALGLILVIGPGPVGVVVAIGLSELPIFARVARAVTMANMNMAHVEAARSMGASNWRILRKHIFPFAVAPLVVQLAIGAPQAVVAEASLSFLGLGTQPPNPSLGAIVSDAQLYLSQSVLGAVFPVLTIATLVLCLTLIADGLQDALDPRQQGRS